MSAVPHVAGSYTFDWDGRDPNGKILADGGVAQCAVASLLRENHIITSGDAPRVSLVKTDPYQMDFSYGQFTRIKYNLSSDAAVTLKLIPPSGTTVTLIDNQIQAAGAHEFEWNGIDTTDTTGKNFITSGEGDYTVTIQAVNPATGTSAIVRGSLKVRL
jgi:flagellar hook assembly protein FlgD